MDIREFETLARAHLLKCVLIFIGSTVLAFGCFAISDWADAHRGWQSDVVGFLFAALSFVPAMLSLLSGLAICAWFKCYKTAKSEAADHELEYLRKLRNEVIGPFPWR